MTGKIAGESSQVIKKRVVDARKIQNIRFCNSDTIFCNGQMGPNELEEFCSLNSSSIKLLEREVKRLGLSARGYVRILKIARTIADLDTS